MPPDSVSPDAHEDGEELRLGQTSRARAANEAIRALARAARSYTIYDPRNDAIKGFLEEVRGRFDALLAQGEDVDLEIRPYELVLDGDVVYLDRDRERSLAFKLYRDGVRKLRLEHGLSWHEITQLLGVLSMRYVGIHQNPAEDDMVTLLWKAGFQNVHIEAIEGFIPEEELEGGVQAAMSFQVQEQDTGLRFPRDFDLPEPELPEPELPLWSALEQSAKDALVAEDDNTHLADMVVALIEELVLAAKDPTDPVDLDEVMPLVRDARPLLLTEEHVPSLVRAAAMLWSLSYDLDEDKLDAVEAIVESMLGPGALARVIRSVSNSRLEPSENLLLMLENLRGQRLPTLLDLLDEERGVTPRRMLRHMLEMHLPTHTATVIARFSERSGSVAADLLRVLARGNPDATAPLMLRLAQEEDLELQLEFLTLVKDMPRDATTRSILVHMLHAASLEVRTRTLETVVEMGESGAFLAVRRHGEALADRQADAEELEAVGRAMAGLAPARAMEAFTEWTKKQGFLGRLTNKGAELRRVAIGGLPELDDEAAEDLLMGLAQSGDEDQQTAAHRALVRWRRREREA
ncbi:MAG: hypothetical protein H6741_23275 [Alphaproteobacteria bacterium]|nr:hypothetical protein [Alphaproteobacteria bacterium]